MNWYNQIKQAISLNVPGASQDPLERAKRMDDSGSIPDETLDRLLDDLGYAEEEEWSEPEDRPWDWEPPKPSVIEQGDDPQLEDLMRRMDEAVAATAIPKRARQLVKTMPDFRADLDNMYVLIERIASEIQRETAGLPKDPIAKMMIAERLESIIPPLFGTTMEQLQEEGFSEGETGFIDL